MALIFYTIIIHRFLIFVKHIFDISAFNVAINKLRKLNQEQKTPIYYKRAKKNEGEVIIINK